MRAEWTQYGVPGWGVGELWTDNGVVLAHEFVFQAVSDTDGAAGPAMPLKSWAEGDESVAEIARSRATSSCGLIDTVKTRLPLDRKSCLTPTELVERLTAFLNGAEASLADVPLDLDWTTRFQRATTEALLRLPRGEVVSYGELAAVAGYPGAARAVGSFCARNRFMFVVPCHRVLGANGIGGYGSAGVDVKRRLLALEGVRL